MSNEINETKNIEANKTDSESDKIKIICDSTFFKKIVKNLNFFNTECKLNFSKKNINIKVVDPAHVSMIDLNIPIFNMEYFDIKKDVSIGIDLDKLDNMFKNINKNDSFKLEYDSNINADKVKINIGLFAYDLNLVDKANLPDSKIPVLDLESHFIIDTKILYDFLYQANKISTYIQITTFKDHIELFAEGDSDNLKVELFRDNYIMLDSPGVFKALYSIDYLLNIVKNLKLLYSDLTLEFKNDHPLKITGTGICNIIVLLAPRIEPE